MEIFKKHNYVNILMKRLILLILIMPCVSAGLGINFETSDDLSINVNTYVGNLTNISQMADVNTPAPADGEFLTWSSAVSAWVANSVGSFNKWIVDTSNGYLSNDIDTLYFDDVLLNATIDDRDTDTTYTNGTGISLVGMFSV